MNNEELEEAIYLIYKSLDELSYHIHFNTDYSALEKLERCPLIRRLDREAWEENNENT